jgi:site-specific DNA-methyltransferase (adenine-specific)
MELNKIYNEDCLITMSNMPDNFIDLTVTSPPYDNLRNYNSYSFDFQSVAKELFRITKKGGVLVWIVSDATHDGTESGTSFRQALFFMECGFNLHDTMIYHKQPPPLTHNRYEQHFEYMFVFSKGKPKTFNPIFEKKIWQDNRVQRAFRREKDGSFDIGNSGKSEKKIKGNVWKYNVGGGHCTDDEIAYNHPAIFPEHLCADHIFSWSNENDIVYDCFGGSGTTAKMAHKLKRKWILSEISTEYTDLANKRLKPYLSQSTLF